MCQQCLAACRKYYPDIPENEIQSFLMGATCYPFGSPDDVAADLKRAAANTDGTIQGAIAFVEEEIERAMDSRQ